MLSDGDFSFHVDFSWAKLYNRPTKVALEPETGALYFADGNGNAPSLYQDSFRN